MWNIQEQGHFMTGFATQVASYDSSTLEFTELLFVKTVCMPECLILYTCGQAK